MNIEKAVLAVITTNKPKIDGGAPIFICDNDQELQQMAANLEAITDGIAHALSDEIYIIVKH
ncbi:capping complex subunit for YIEGIA [Ornithinibacillus halophilus]|uniref:Uncharacterized protein n=1 Tax=Ornithinibacillus halophilus TaxID=930117 RepID=A0A1M5CQX5_9BACI|nr:hypothetical protein [Ornithinibacillus halophilus]SHF57154.1 hypothetical protein SAMN05216225_1001351 [Ornithinibacillus halophilus]